jgi:hypothetical protein
MIGERFNQFEPDARRLRIAAELSAIVVARVAFAARPFSVRPLVSRG